MALLLVPNTPSYKLKLDHYPSFALFVDSSSMISYAPKQKNPSEKLLKSMKPILTPCFASFIHKTFNHVDGFPSLVPLRNPLLNAPMTKSYPLRHPVYLLPFLPLRGILNASPKRVTSLFPSKPGRKQRKNSANMLGPCRK